MWPPIWGYHFWFLRHASGYVYQERANFIEEELEQIRMYITSSCMFLPCPACTIHCGQYVVSNPVTQKIQQPRDFWTYDIEFHNTVNERSQKLKLNEPEAIEALQQGVRDRGGNPDLLYQTFLFDFWIPLWFSCFRAAQDPAMFLKHLKSYCYILPFAINNAPVRQMLLQALPNTPPKDEKEAKEALVQLYNSVALFFGHVHLSVEEFDRECNKPYQHDYIKMVRSHQMREEDHKKMLEYQRQVNESRLNKEGESSSRGWMIATIVLSVLLSLCVLVMVLTYIIYRVSGHAPFCPRPPNALHVK